MHFQRRRPSQLIIVILSMATIVVGQTRELSAADESPNFLFILADDQGWTSTSTSMHPDVASTSDYYQTPSIARLAEQGMRFTQGYSPAALCSPTRRSIQFGQTPVRQGDDDVFAKRYSVVGNRLTIPRILKSANPKYAAAHFGKWDLRLAESRETADVAPEDLGYDESDGNNDNGPGSAGDNGEPLSSSKEEKWDGHAILKDPKRIFSLTEKASDFMTRMTEAKRPFYLQVSHYAVHASFQSLAESYETAELRKKGVIHNNPAFAAMLADLDTGVGILLDKLDDLGIADNTYVIYMADNGGVPWIPPQKAKHFKNPKELKDRGQNSPLRGGKWAAFEGGIRVPFMVRGPGVRRGAFCHVPVVGWDILPTVADLAGYQGKFTDDLDGGSFCELLLNNGQGEVERQRDYLIFHRYSLGYGHTVIREGDFKLIRFWHTNVPGPLATYHLFNLAEDLGETDNLAEKMPGKVRDLEQKMMSYFKEVDSNIAGQ